jgi:class 3 adenylate cyclase
VTETRKLAAILVSDIVGYSRLAGADEDRILARLRTLRSDLIDPTIAVHHGRIVKRTGDGSVIEFRSVVDAVNCAIEIQRAMVERNAEVASDRRIEFRIGIHLGDVVEESDGDLMGDGVNIAARLEGVAKPGGICISDDAYRQVKSRLDLKVSDLGPVSLKNIAEPMRAYSLEVGVPAQAKPAEPVTPVTPAAFTPQKRRFGLASLAAALAALLVAIAGGAWWFLDANRLGSLALLRLWSEFEQRELARAPTENPEAPADQTGPPSAHFSVGYSLHPLHFKAADGSPMSVDRVGNGFLLAPDGILSNAAKWVLIHYVGPEGKFWTARWDLGGGMKIIESNGSGGWRASDSFRFVDRDGNAWQGVRIGDGFVLKQLPALTPEVHADCVELVLPGHHHYRSCCAPDGMQISVNESEDETIKYVSEFSYLDWSNAPRIAAWKGERFLVRSAGVKPAETTSLELLDWDGMRQIANWDAVAARFKVSAP